MVETLADRVLRDRSKNFFGVMALPMGSLREQGLFVQVGVYTEARRGKGMSSRPTKVIQGRHTPDPAAT